MKRLVAVFLAVCAVIGVGFMATAGSAFATTSCTKYKNDDTIQPANSIYDDVCFSDSPAMGVTVLIQGDRVDHRSEFNISAYGSGLRPDEYTTGTIYTEQCNVGLINCVLMHAAGISATSLNCNGTTYCFLDPSVTAESYGHIYYAAASWDYNNQWHVVNAATPAIA
jgi:hypothetical protein